MKHPPFVLLIVSLFFVNLLSAQPANDNCANAISLSTGPTLVANVNSLTSQTLNGATNESAGPATTCGGATTSPDVWYKFVAQGIKATIRIANLGANWGTNMRVSLYTGSCGSFSEAQCASISSPPFNMNLGNSTALVLGQTYYIRVYKTTTAAPTGGNAAWAFDIALVGPQTNRIGEVFKQTTISAASVINTPWEVSYGPDGNLWVTDSKGYKAYRINPTTLAKKTMIDISQGSSGWIGGTHARYNVTFTSASLSAIHPAGWNASQTVPWPQGGFAGLVLHPKFMDPVSPKNYVYISYVHQYDGAGASQNSGFFFTNYLIRLTYNPSTDSLEAPVALCDTLPGSSDHNSQRLIIAPVGGVDYLFYAQGEMGAGQLVNQTRVNKAQDSTSYEGKILRFNLEPDGDVDSTDMWIPSDNPYNKPGKQSAVWTMGIRNNQGFAYNAALGVLYGSSHGPYSDDELNIIQRYKNYGHPRVIGYASDGNYNGNSTPGTSTSINAGAPFPSGTSSLAPIGDEAANAAAINASGYAPYVDPIYSAYPGPVSGATSVASIWATNTPGNGSWPSEAWSGLDVYTNSVIPGWKNSLVVAGLKWGRVLRFEMNSTGTAIVPTNGADTITYFQGPNRFRDLAFDPNGKDIYISMESSTGVGPNGSTTVAPTVSQCTNCIIKYTFLGYSPDATGKSTIPSYIAVSNPAGNTIVSGNSVTIDNTNNNLWVPITGSDGNIMAEINANGNNLGVVTAKVYKNTNAIRNANGVRYLDRNYTITPTTQPTTPVSIRLYFSKTEYDALDADPMSGVSAISDLKILKNQDPAEAAISSNTTQIVPTYSGTQGAAGYVLQANISSFSSFFFASSNIILPLKLVSFKAALKNNAGDLQWVTTNEVSTANFILERSTDGQSFQKIATVPAKGNMTLNNYSYTDNDAAYQSSNVIYYRLKMVDADGSYIYSNVVTITLPLAAGKVVLFPNPASNQVMITVALQSDSKVKWHLNDNGGHIVNHSTTQLHKGKNSFSIDISNLSSGIYFFRITGGGIDEKIKLEKL